MSCLIKRRANLSCVDKLKGGDSDASLSLNITNAVVCRHPMRPSPRIYRPLRRADAMSTKPPMTMHHIMQCRLSVRKPVALLHRDAHKNVLVIYVANNARPGNEAAHEVNFWALKCVDQHGQSAQINVPGDVPDVRALLCSQSQCQFLHFQ